MNTRLQENSMKIKTNVRAGKQSGTVLSNSDLGISGGTVSGGGGGGGGSTPAPVPVTYTRCVGI
jgi:hypothetical protein